MDGDVEAPRTGAVSRDDDDADPGFNTSGITVTTEQVTALLQHVLAVTEDGAACDADSADLECVAVRRHEAGFVNVVYFVTTAGGTRYVLRLTNPLKVLSRTSRTSRTYHDTPVAVRMSYAVGSGCVPFPCVTVVRACVHTGIHGTRRSGAGSRQSTRLRS